MTPTALHAIPTDVLWSADTLTIARWTTTAGDDWPGRTVLTVLLQGCPWSCTSCETPDLRDPVTAGSVTWHEVRTVIQRSRSGLDGVVFSGGEPTRQDGLADAMEQVYPIFEHGLDKLVAKSGKLRGDGATVKLPIPKERKPETTMLSIQVTPSLAVTAVLLATAHAAFAAPPAPALPAASSLRFFCVTITTLPVMS